MKQFMFSTEKWNKAESKIIERAGGNIQARNYRGAQERIQRMLPGHSIHLLVDESETVRLT